MYMYLLSIYLSLSIFLSITGEMTSHILKLAIEARSKTLGEKFEKFLDKDQVFSSYKQDKRNWNYLLK